MKSVPRPRRRGRADDFQFAGICQPICDILAAFDAP